MIKLKASRISPIEIDLTGPKGNAYELLGCASLWAEQLGIDPKPILGDMRSADYEHLISVFDKHFGKFVVLLK